MSDVGMRSSIDLSTTTARILLDTGAVLFRPDRPFFFSSGWASPVFVDCKRIISFPIGREILIELCAEKILSEVGYAELEGIAGADGGGVPFASIIASRLHLPLVVVRKQSAGLGPTSQTDGVVEPGRRLLLVDDVTTDGRTKATMSAALRRAGAVVPHAFVVFRYGIFDAVLQAEELGVNLFSLLTWRELLTVAAQQNAFAQTELDAMEEYIHDPLRWSKEHGGLGPDEFRRNA